MAEDLVSFALAMFLEVDIRQISDASDNKNPWQLFSGNRVSDDVILESEPILLGYITQLHYVSLQPSEGVPKQLRLEDFERIGMNETLMSIQLGVQLAAKELAEDLLDSVALIELKNQEIAESVGLTPVEEQPKYKLDCTICPGSTMHSCVECNKPVCAIYCSEPVGEENRFLKRHKAGDPRCSQSW